MASRCSPPKSVTVKPYWRAKPRKKRSGPRAGEKYYVAEHYETGRTCEHHHRTRSGAFACATQLNRQATRSSGRKAAKYITDKRTAR